MRGAAHDLDAHILGAAGGQVGASQRAGPLVQRHRHATCYEQAVRGIHTPAASLAVLIPADHVADERTNLRRCGIALAHQSEPFVQRPLPFLLTAVDQ
ncbi:hypothetical protein GCM10022267_72290 [Lentzea roselyniae]|uniref:Uncharacterized protein n=1 Tax=Lentzea roselyniae TaxID=531940 RepID=A0ABP7C2C3_9PSEU